LGKFQTHEESPPHLKTHDSYISLWNSRKLCWF